MHFFFTNSEEKVWIFFSDSSSNRQQGVFFSSPSFSPSGFRLFRNPPFASFHPIQQRLKPVKSFCYFFLRRPSHKSSALPRWIFNEPTSSFRLHSWSCFPHRSSSTRLGMRGWLKKKKVPRTTPASQFTHISSKPRLKSLSSPERQH